MRPAPYWHGLTGRHLWALFTPSDTRFSQRACDIPTASSASCAPHCSGNLPPDYVRNSNTVMPF
ncbi:hypothetical protein Pvag_pPag20126 (plasmid) [Pantoea vagans C9-1]|nr:hypothetical protein Pvag_pPag20126 [Pantoea vagans C9-1]